MVELKRAAAELVKKPDGGYVEKVRARLVEKWGVVMTVCEARVMTVAGDAGGGDAMWMSLWAFGLSRG